MSDCSFRLPNQRTVELKETDIKISGTMTDSASVSDSNAEMMTDSQDYLFLDISSQIDSNDD